MQLSQLERQLPTRPQGPHLAGPAVAKAATELGADKAAGVDKTQSIDGKAIVSEPKPVNAADLSQGATAPPTPLSPTDTVRMAQNQGKLKPVAPEPMSKVLMAHFHSMWTASTKVVEQIMPTGNDKNLMGTQSSADAQNQLRNINPAAVPGELSKSALTYTPGKVKKVEAS